MILLVLVCGLIVGGFLLLQYQLYGIEPAEWLERLLSTSDEQIKQPRWLHMPRIWSCWRRKVASRRFDSQPAYSGLPG